jgi:hypothetical protein
MPTKIHAVQVLYDNTLMGFTLCGQRRVPQGARNAAWLPLFSGVQGDRCGLCLRAINATTRSYGAPTADARALIIS